MEVVYYIIIAFLLTRIPLVGIYVRLIYTVIHEVWHILVAKITGGKGHKIAVFQDTSGVATTSSSSWISRILTAYAGYTGASLTAMFLFYFLHTGHHGTVLVILLTVLLLAVIFWLRNGFGFIWALSLIGLLFLLLEQQWQTLHIHISYLFASIILVESIISAAHIMVISLARPRRAGDATSLQQATFIPALIWGFIFFWQSVYIGYVTLSQFIL
ncbi:M50 family metallopeptidase [Aquibacillus koreensis]|uniref:M50 family metallopeptidase n=1 Tax=Aquibacillus koreensis TaxID=279446 RepID=A0A9X4AJT5_9BACI|nr:M50 family metallopeptidase [Aquibacillus koreensis]MCT2536995.1 M50 family metallopeptidase [Aquibacillus koreensis]MDC3422351.1 M50 family metallopeptidase [Aquibacillus koreensis]